MEEFFLVLSASFAMLSGVAWVRAASITLPPPGIAFVLGKETTKRVVAHSKLQGRWNGAAAWLAALAALSQAAGMIVHLGSGAAH